MPDYRIEKDSLGEINVPQSAYYGAQTQRAVQNFPISGKGFPPAFIHSLGVMKFCAATANGDLGLIDPELVNAISRASKEVASGKWDTHFPVDLYQTGSGTSTNMNANEVIAKRANEFLKDGKKVHPNDHVNFGQSSNDVIPTVTRIAAMQALLNSLLPAIDKLVNALQKKAGEYAHVVKPGRTHLMDAMPITFAQQFGGYIRQLTLAKKRILSAKENLRELPQGGTAVGTGINTHAKFGEKFAGLVSSYTGTEFIEAVNHFEAQGSLDAIVELSGSLKGLSLGLWKLVNDLRWMNSGPLTGIAEISLAPLQPGSSIMPGKVNPVIEEACAMVCAQVIGHDTTISFAANSGNFELNVMQPIAAHCLLESIHLLSTSITVLAEKSISGLRVNEAKINELLMQNPVLVTALNPVIGYDQAAKIAKQAQSEKRSILDVAEEVTGMDKDELSKILNPNHMTKGGFPGDGK